MLAGPLQGLFPAISGTKFSFEDRLTGARVPKELC